MTSSVPSSSDHSLILKVDTSPKTSKRFLVGKKRQTDKDVTSIRSGLFPQYVYDKVLELTRSNNRTRAVIDVEPTQGGTSWVFVEPHSELSQSRFVVSNLARSIIIQESLGTFLQTTPNLSMRVVVDDNAENRLNYSLVFTRTLDTTENQRQVSGLTQSLTKNTEPNEYVRL